MENLQNSMLLNGRFPVKIDKIFGKDGNLMNISELNPGDTIKISFLLKKWSWRNRINTVGGRNRKLSDLLMGKDKLRLDIAIYVNYKLDKTNKVHIVRSNIESVWTQDTDREYSFDITIPGYDDNKLDFFSDNRISKISCHLLISLDSMLTEDEVEICDIKVEAKEIKLGYNDRLYEFQFSSVDYSNIINFFQTTNRTSGYGMMGDGIVREINKGDFGFQIRDFCKDGKGRVNDNEMTGLKSKIGLLLNVPTMWFKARNSKYTIGYSMFECTRIPSSWVGGCNRVDRIFVPVINNIEGFRSSGVSKDIPIDVIPIGVDTDIYDCSKCDFQFDFGKVDFCKNEKDTYKFLVVNDNQSRKNNGMIIKAIGEEFEKEIKDNKVVLITRFCHGKKLIKDKFAHHIMRYLKDEDMVKLINTCDCMVNISSGENGDIPILQAMAMEKPVIISEDKLIHSEIIDEGKEMFDRFGVAFPVKIDRWERAYCSNEYKNSKYFDGLGEDAVWIVPSYEDLRKQLRYVYDNRNEKSVIEVGKNARKYILEKRTVKIAVKKMLDIFDSLE